MDGEYHFSIPAHDTDLPSVANVLGRAIASACEKQDPSLVAGFEGFLSDLTASEEIADIARKAFDPGLVDPSMISREFFEATLQLSREEDWRAKPKAVCPLIVDVVAEVAESYEDAGKDSFSDSDDSDHDGIRTLESVKVFRPMGCGSGDFGMYDFSKGPLSETFLLRQNLSMRFGEELP